jgi:hypothetical protein
LKGVGGVGGSDDVEYALWAVLIAPIASVRSSCCCCCEDREVAVTDVASAPSGAATLRKTSNNGMESESGMYKQKNKTKGRFY